MAGQPAHPVRDGSRPEPLPATHWTVFGPVRWPGRDSGRIDEVVVGPSGIHVIVHVREAQAAAVTRTEAHAAGAAVAGLLPSRYHQAIRPAACLCQTEDVSDVVDGVRLSSPVPLRHALRHQSRVLSTSEVAGISRRLELGLVRYPDEAPSAPRRLRRTWLRLAAASTTAAAAAVVVLQLGPGRLW
jgi:hypothetical protein